MKIAFLGLGTMGRPMAANLARAGFALTVWNRSAEACAPLVALGARAATSPAEAVAGADVVVSMLADDASTRTSLIDSGALTAMAAGAVHLNMATISVALAEELAAVHRAEGQGYVAAPVLGRWTVAEAGELNIIAAGAAGDLERVAPLLDVLGRKTWILGDQPAQANAAKLAANFMMASAIGTMGEASALVGGYGVAKNDFLEMMTTTLFASPIYQTYGKAIMTEAFEPAGFKLALGLKDVRLALAAGEAVNVPQPIAGVLRDSHLECLARGEGALDWTALSRAAALKSGK